MTSFNELIVKLTETRHKQPLAELQNLPGPGIEMTPAQMRQFADALVSAANDCEQRMLYKKRLGNEIKSYPFYEI